MKDRLSGYESDPAEEVELECPACGETWFCDRRKEYGTWWPESEEDLYCPGCGVEGIADDVV